MKTETPDLQFCRAVLAVSRLLAAGFFVFVILVYILCFKKCSQPYLFLHFVLFCSTVFTQNFRCFFIFLRVKPKTGLILCLVSSSQDASLDSHCSKAKHCRNVLGGQDKRKLFRYKTLLNFTFRGKNRLQKVQSIVQSPSSIYSCSIGHILEHEVCHLGCWAVKEKFLKRRNFC